MVLTCYSNPLYADSCFVLIFFYIDYNLIRQNPKIFCGFSDSTALQNAIFHKAGLVTYSGPQFSSFALKEELEYTLKFFKRIFFENMPIQLTCSTRRLDEKSMLNRENRIFNNEGYWLIHPGEAKGTLIGGNISTLQLLHGTPYLPSFDNAILFLEADNITAPYEVGEFDRDLQSLIHQPCFKNVTAIVFGRFEKSFGMNLERLTFIINSKPELKHIPIIANADFGHTIPIFTFPVGGTCDIKAKKDANITINLVEH